MTFGNVIGNLGSDWKVVSSQTEQLLALSAQSQAFEYLSRFKYFMHYCLECVSLEP